MWKAILFNPQERESSLFDPIAEDQIKESYSPFLVMTDGCTQQHFFMSKRNVHVY